MEVVIGCFIKQIAVSVFFGMRSRSRTLIYGFGDRSATIYTNLINMATYTGLEPVTSGVTGQRSTLLN